MQHHLHSLPVFYFLVTVNYFYKDAGAQKSQLLDHKGNEVLYGAVIFTYKNVYQFAHTGQNMPDSSEVHRLFQKCGSSVWALLHVTFLLTRIWM
jgi:hypothetical protein